MGMRHLHFRWGKVQEFARLPFEPIATFERLRTRNDLFPPQSKARGNACKSCKRFAGVPF